MNARRSHARARVAIARLAVASALLATGCGGGDARPDDPTAAATEAAPVADAAGPWGIYEVTWTAEELVETIGIDEPWVHGNAGRARIELDDGAFAFEYVTGPSTGDRCEGTVEATDDRLVLTGTTDPSRNDCGDEFGGLEIVDAAWDRDGDRLVLSGFTLSDEPDVTWFMAAWLGTKPLRVVDTTAASEATALRFAATGGFGDVTLATLVEELEAVSDGALVLDVADEWDITATTPDVERRLVEAVAAGELDLALVGTRAMDDLGVPDFRALTAPMVVDSHELLRAVVTSDLPHEMLEAVDALGVEGLGIVGGPLRRPAATAAPLVRPEDYAGVTFSVFSSGAGEDAVAALGAVPTDVAPAARDAGLEDGTIGALENSLDLVASRPVVGHVTANVALWPATGVLVANPDALARLGSEQRQALLDAVERTVETSVAEPPLDEAHLAGLVCERGGTVVEASDDDLEALRSAFAPVVTGLAEDAATASHLAAIEALRATVTPEVLELPASCTS